MNTHAIKQIADFGKRIPGARKDLPTQHDPRKETNTPREPARHTFKLFARRNGDERIWFVANGRDRLRRPLHQFDTLESARMWNYHPGYQALLDRWHEIYKAGFIGMADCRGLTNGERVGPDYRQGSDCDPQRFMAEIQPSGVQFGNWQNNRDVCLNAAYDAVRDLTNFLNVRQGWLFAGLVGLAFGARGTGGAAAHYELHHRTINLTKTQGPGCLAHEIFHALDHRWSEPFGNKLCLHPLLKEAVIDIPRGLVERSRLADMHRSSGCYFSTPQEMMARCFEAWVSRVVHNDYLANIRQVDSFKNPPAYPYPLTDEMPEVDRIFNRLFAGIL